MNTEPLDRENDPDRVVSFRQGDLLELLGSIALPPWWDGREWLGGHVDAAPIAQRLIRALRSLEAELPKVGDRVEDGGEPGELVRCDHCHGQGLLFKPDNTPPLAQPEAWDDAADG